MRWEKHAGDGFMAVSPPLTVKIAPKPDGRWSWQVFSGDKRSPMASGVAASLGAAKTVTEQLVKRSGGG